MNSKAYLLEVTHEVNSIHHGDTRVEARNAGKAAGFEDLRQSLVGLRVGIGVGASAVVLVLALQVMAGSNVHLSEPIDRY